MLKLITRSFFVFILFVSPTFADEILSTFNQQGDINAPAMLEEESYFADTVSAPSEEPWYFGLSLGANFIPLNPAIQIGSSSANLKKKTVIAYNGGLYGGYGVNFRRFYLGTELGFGYNSLNKSFADGSNNVSLSVKQPIVVGLDIIPGYLTQSRDFLFYGRLGLGAGLTNLKLIDNSNSAVPVSDTTSKIGLSLRAGLGIEYFLSDTFGLRLEYIYARYSKPSATYASSDGRQYSYNVAVFGVNQVNFGLSVHF